MSKLKTLFANLTNRSSDRAWSIIRRATNEAMPVVELRFKRKHMEKMIFSDEMIETDPFQWLFHSAHEKITEHIGKAQFAGEGRGIEAVLNQIEEKINTLSREDRNGAWRKVLDHWSSSDSPLLHRARDLYESRHPEFATDDTIKRWQDDAEKVSYRNKYERSPFISPRKLSRMIAEERAIIEADPHGVGRY